MQRTNTKRTTVHGNITSAPGQQEASRELDLNEGEEFEELSNRGTGDQDILITWNNRTFTVSTDRSRLTVKQLYKAFYAELNTTNNYKSVYEEAKKKVPCFGYASTCSSVNFFGVCAYCTLIHGFKYLQKSGHMIDYGDYTEYIKILNIIVKENYVQNNETDDDPSYTAIYVSPTVNPDFRRYLDHLGNPGFDLPLKDKSKIHNHRENVIKSRAQFLETLTSMDSAKFATHRQSIYDKYKAALAVVVYALYGTYPKNLTTLGALTAYVIKDNSITKEVLISLDDLHIEDFIHIITCVFNQPAANDGGLYYSRTVSISNLLIFIQTKPNVEIKNDYVTMDQLHEFDIVCCKGPKILPCIDDTLSFLQTSGEGEPAVINGCITQRLDTQGIACSGSWERAILVLRSLPKQNENVFSI